MMAILTVFNEQQSKDFTLSGKPLREFQSVFPEWKERLKAVRGAVAYRAGREGRDKPAIAMAIASVDIKAKEIRLRLTGQKQLGLSSGMLSSEIYRLACLGQDQKKYAPQLYFLPRDDFDELIRRAQLMTKTQKMIEAGDYKGVCMLFAPFQAICENKTVWNSADLLYQLGLCCSKLSVTLLVKAAEKKKLEEAKRYRDYCAAFFERGAVLEPESARCATALAYRYYSNVHELMRPGERRDQDLLQQIDLALEWLTRAIDIYPKSIRNHYRKGKLIIEKQIPYLLFGKHASCEGKKLRGMKAEGVQHLKTAITLFESLTDEDRRQHNRREYAKALFVLGGHYIDDANLPLHEYYLGIITGHKGTASVSAVSVKKLESALEYLEKCFGTETNMAKDQLDMKALATMNIKWTHSPIEKLYKLGCAHSALAFAACMRQNSDDVKMHVQKAVYYLDAAAKTAMAGTEKRRNTWHISEKLAWTHMHAGRYEKAAALLTRAKSGYILNTRAIALLLCGGPKANAKAAEAIKTALKDRYNLASGLSGVLLAYIQKQNNQKPAPLTKTLSAKNKRLAQLLDIK